MEIQNQKVRLLYKGGNHVSNRWPIPIPTETISVWTRLLWINWLCRFSVGIHVYWSLILILIVTFLHRIQYCGRRGYVIWPTASVPVSWWMETITWWRSLLPFRPTRVSMWCSLRTPREELKPVSGWTCCREGRWRGRILKIKIFFNHSFRLSQYCYCQIKGTIPLNP